MQIEGAVAVVSGANRGLGREFARQLVERGAATVFAGARDPGRVDLAGVVPVRLDVTDPASIDAVAREAGATTLLVNNAGVSTRANLVGGDLDDVARELDVHFWGVLRMTRAFAPVLGANGGGAVLNVLSALSWTAFDGATAYSAAKAAAWMLTNGTRLELAGQGTQVLGLHLGAADTDMMAGWDGPKLDPAAVIRDALDGLEAGAAEVLADPGTAAVKARLALDPQQAYADALGR